jgi:hypothetical protein
MHFVLRVLVNKIIKVFKRKDVKLIGRNWSSSVVGLIGSRERVISSEAVSQAEKCVSSR